MAQRQHCIIFRALMLQTSKIARAPQPCRPSHTINNVFLQPRINFSHHTPLSSLHCPLCCRPHTHHAQSRAPLPSLLTCCTSTCCITSSVSPISEVQMDGLLESDSKLLWLDGFLLCPGVCCQEMMQTHKAPSVKGLLSKCCFFRANM